MKLLHKKRKTTSAVNASLKLLKELLESELIHASDGSSFQEIEKTIQNCFISAARELTGSILSTYDVDNTAITIEGKRYHKALKASEKTYHSLLGPISVKRCLYRNKKHNETICPLEKLTGIVEGFWTPHAAQSALLFVTEMPSDRAKKLFKQVGLMSPSSSSLDKLPKQVSAHWERHRQTYEENLRQSLTVPEDAVTLSISLDGVLIPTRCTRVIASDSRYEEASCGTLTLYDTEGSILLKRQYGRMPEFKKKTLKNQLENDLLSIIEQRPDLDIIKVADGARDNWDYLSNMKVQGVEVLDFYHASEHLKKVFDSVYSKHPEKANKSFFKYREYLLEHAHGIDKVIQHLRYLKKKHPTNKIIITELTYFKRNQHRAHYQHVKSKGWPIGSGVVEAVCKTLVTQRLKCSGMRWDYQGGQAILTFRALNHSGLFKRAWTHIIDNYYQFAVANDDINPSLFAA